MKILVLIVFGLACVTSNRHGYHKDKDTNENADVSSSNQEFSLSNGIQAPLSINFGTTTETQSPQQEYLQQTSELDGTTPTNSIPATNDYNKVLTQNQNMFKAVHQSDWAESSKNALFENGPNHIAHSYHSGQQFESNAVIDLMSLNRWRTMFQRGRQMIQQLPSMGLTTAGRIISDVPTPMEIFHYGKQTLLELPNEVFAYVIDSVCSAAASMNVIQPRHEPNIDALKFLLITPENQVVIVPLRNAQSLFEDVHFKPELPVVVVVTGWNSNENETNNVIDTLYKAYRCRGDYNFVVIDTDTTVDSLYSWSAYNTKTVGNILGEALVGLRNLVGLNNIHVIGQSLGANIASEAGRHFARLTNDSLFRITGLDPARPCFSEGDYPAGLQRGDAKFVDIIHTNPGVMGGKESVGDIDFFPNGHDSMQPGCTEIVCCHNRAYQYFAESVYPGKENNFVATKCSSLRAYKMHQCGTDEKLPMGIATPSRGRGTFYLVTRRKSPYGVEQPESGMWPYRSEEKQQCKPNKTEILREGVLE